MCISRCKLIPVVAYSQVLCVVVEKKNLCTVVDITFVSVASANSCAFKAVVGCISRIVTHEMQLFLIFAQTGILKPGVNISEHELPYFLIYKIYESDLDPESY